MANGIKNIIQSFAIRSSVDNIQGTMWLKLAVLLLLIVSEATCRRKAHVHNPEDETESATLRTEEPSAAGDFCTCFDGSTGDGADKCFKDRIHGIKINGTVIKNCIRDPEEARTGKCQVASLMRIVGAYQIDLARLGGSTGANAKLGELYQSLPSFKRVCNNWDSHGRDYIKSKLSWIVENAFGQNDLSDSRELADLSSAFSAPAWRMEVDRVCEKDPPEEYCKLGNLGEKIFQKAAAFKSEINGLAQTSESYKLVLDAFKLNFFLIKKNHQNLLRRLESWREEEANAILEKQLQIFVDNIKNVKADILVKVLAVLPEAGSIKGCEESRYSLWCHFKFAMDQTRQLVMRNNGNAVKKRKQTQAIAKVIHTNLDYKEFLAESQADKIWSFTASQSLDTLNFAEKMKNELEQTSSARFSELRQYFTKLQAFNYEKAQADIAYLQGEIDAYNKTSISLSKEVSDRLYWLLVKALGGTAAGLIERTAVLIECFNPTGWVTDSDKISDLKDSIEGLGEQIVGVVQATALFQSFENLANLLLEIGMDFYSNTVFLTDTYKLLPEPGEEISPEDFEKSKDRFLSNYNDYSPQVFEDNIAKLESEWESVIEDACGLLDEKSTIAVSLVNIVVPHYCWELKALVQELIEVYNEIYGYQFELMDAMAEYIRAMTAYTSAQAISKDFDRITDASEINGNIISESKFIGMASYVAYEAQQQQAISEYCDILTYKNGGKEFKECKKRNADVAEVLSLIPAKCTFTYEYVDIPVKQRKASRGRFGPTTTGTKERKGPDFDVDYSAIDLTAALAGRKMSFQVPNKKWLIKYKWITKEEKDDPIFIAGLDLFLPRTKPGTRHVVSEAAFGPRNIIRVKDSPYKLSPPPRFIYEYTEGQGAAVVCARPSIDNPYKHCKTSSPGNICPLSKDRPLNNDAELYPSIFSRFIISATASGRPFKSPLRVARMTIKAGVSLCKFHSKAKVEEMSRRKREALAYGCCESGQYWLFVKQKCAPCSGGLPKFFNSWCLKN